MSNFKEMGRLTRDFEIKQVGKDYVCKSDLVYNRSYKNKEGNYISDFIRIEYWVSEAYVERIRTNYTKGKRVLITGNLEMDKYQAKDGTTRTTYKIRCNRFNGCVLIDYPQKQDSNYIKKESVNSAEFSEVNEFSNPSDFNPFSGESEDDIPF